MSTAIPIVRADGQGERRRFHGGGLITMKATAQETGGSFLLFEDHMTQGKTTPLHVHADEDETLYVLDGEILVHIDGAEHLVPADSAARLALVAGDHTRRILEYEQEMRAVLRLSLESAPPDLQLPMNRRMRIGWIEEALAPLRGDLADDELRRLVLVIGATLGIEAFVWLTDIARVSREDAAAIMCANAAALLQAALSRS